MPPTAEFAQWKRVFLSTARAIPDRELGTALEAEIQEWSPEFFHPCALGCRKLLRVSFGLSSPGDDPHSDN